MSLAVDNRYRNSQAPFTFGQQSIIWVAPARDSGRVSAQSSLLPSWALHVRICCCPTSPGIKQLLTLLTTCLVRTDYVFGVRKFGGNAQAITNKRWLHHTSFLWDFDPANMAALLNPAKQPDYRQVRCSPGASSSSVECGTSMTAAVVAAAVAWFACTRTSISGGHLLAHGPQSRCYFCTCLWCSLSLNHVLLLPLLQGREHGSFLVRLKEVLPSRQQFIQELQDNADQHFELRVRRGTAAPAAVTPAVLVSCFCQCLILCAAFCACHRSRPLHT
jgi:hypothetical protein